MFNVRLTAETIPKFSSHDRQPLATARPFSWSIKILAPTSEFHFGGATLQMHSFSPFCKKLSLPGLSSLA